MSQCMIHRLAKHGSTMRRPKNRRKRRRSLQRRQRVSVISACLALATLTLLSVAQENGVAPPVADEDPEGLKLVSISDPLEQASRLLRPLEAHTQPRREVLLVSFDVALRRGKGDLLSDYRAFLKAVSRTVSASDPCS